MDKHRCVTAMVKKMASAFPAKESWVSEAMDIRDSKEGKLGTRENRL